MALIQSDHAKGRKQAPYAAEAGNVVCARYEIDLNGAGATDVVELGILPAYCRIVDATLVTDGLGTGVTANVGLIDAEPGQVPGDVDVGTEIFDGADVAAGGVVRLSNKAAMLLGTEETDRPVGMTVSGASQGKAILLLQYAAYGDY